MKDEVPLNPDQLKIKTKVHERSLLLSMKYHLPSKCTGHVDITNEDVLSFIKKKNSNKEYLLVLTGSPRNT